MLPALPAVAAAAAGLMTALGNTVLHLQLAPAPTVHLLTSAKGPEGQVTAGLLPMLQATAARAVEAPGARPHTQRLTSSWAAVEIVAADALLMLTSGL